MLDGKPTVFIAAPYYGNPHPGSRMALYEEASDGSRYVLLQPIQRRMSAPTVNYNDHLVAALNHPVQGGVDLFVMLHDDIQPSRGWIDTLCDELIELDADCVSAIVAIKNHTGLTSTAIQTPTGVKRLTMHEIMRLPETFDAEMAGFPAHSLLINTGCFVANFRRPWWQEVVLAEHEDGQSGFFYRSGIRKNASGKWEGWFEPEDWNFARDLNKAKTRVFATRKVKTIHYGEQGFINHQLWGTCPVDPAWKAHPTDREHVYHNIHGWFDFDDIYREAVQRASDGSCFVEVGSWLGKSAAFMAVEIANSGKRILFDCIDHWQGNAEQPGMRAAASKQDLCAAFNANMIKYRLDHIVKSVRKPSVEAAGDYADGSLDFVFIDAGHEYDSVKADIEAWLPKVKKPGGVIAGHDFDMSTDPGVVRAVIEKNPEVEVRGRSWVWEW